MNIFFRTKIFLTFAMLSAIPSAFAEPASLSNQVPPPPTAQQAPQVVVSPAPQAPDAPQVVVTQAPVQTQTVQAPAPQIEQVPQMQHVQQVQPQAVAVQTQTVQAPPRAAPTQVSNVFGGKQAQIVPEIPSGPTSSPQSAQSEFDQWLSQHGYATNPNTKPIPANPPGHLAAPTNRPPTIRQRPRRVFTRYRPMTYEESKKVMLEAAPKPLFPETDDSKIAFNTLLQQNMPMSPQQIVKLRQQIDTSQRAASIPATIPPKPVSSTLMINLAPGTTPPAVRLAQGYVSSLVFVDSAGAPWPIAAFDIGNPRAVNIQWDGKTNILLIQAVLPYSDGDIVIRLVGLPTPITLELVAGQRVVDYRVDIHVSGIGPNTKELPVGTLLPNSANQLLLGVLDGIAPPGSRLLTVIGADSQAWLLGDRLYLRTRFTVLSPGWIGTMVSPDGMHAYEMPKTSSVLISRYGEPAEIRIEGL